MILRGVAMLAAAALLGCGDSGSCRRNLSDGGCDIYITTDHCPDCPAGFLPVGDASVTVGCVPSSVGCH